MSIDTDKLHPKKAIPTYSHEVCTSFPLPLAACDIVKLLTL